MGGRAASRPRRSSASASHARARERDAQASPDSPDPAAAPRRRGRREQARARRAPSSSRGRCRLPSRSRIELDAVDRAVAVGDRLSQLGQPPERRVAVHRRRRLERCPDRSASTTCAGGGRTSGLPRPRSTSGSPSAAGRRADAVRAAARSTARAAARAGRAGTHHAMLCVLEVVAGIPHLGYVQSSDEGYPGRRMFSATRLSAPVRHLFDWRNLG